MPSLSDHLFGVMLTWGCIMFVVLLAGIMDGFRLKLTAIVTVVTLVLTATVGVLHYHFEFVDYNRSEERAENIRLLQQLECWERQGSACD